MSDRRIRLAVLGDPLSYTLSPQLHRAGLEALGWECDSRPLRTPAESLGERLHELADSGCRGANLTTPLKEAILGLLGRVSAAGLLARSVNTVGFDPDGWWGETTDGAGFLDLLASLGRRPERERCLLLGAGGAARSLALALREAGCDEIKVSARRPGAAEAWQEVRGITWVSWGSEAERESLARATLVVQATPLEREEELATVDHASRRLLLIDLRYGRELTPWVRRARSLGREAYDGLGLLVFQARRSLSLWTGRAVPVDPLARAVGWPR